MLLAQASRRFSSWQFRRDPMLFYILLTFQILICVSLAGLILIQRSEGGALGMGGGPSGFMSARGAGNLLTRLTAIFGVLFFANSIGLTVVGNLTGKPGSAVDQVDTTKLPANTNVLTPPAATAASSSAAPSSAAPSLNDLPLAGAAAPSPASQVARPAAVPAPSLGPSVNLSMPKQTTTGKVGLGNAAPASKPAQKAASSSSSTSVRSASAAPSSLASTAPAASTTSPASSQ